jgi:carbamoyltransferase
MMMKALVLTLGHNSSAILVEDGNIIVGYEEERLTGIKADSKFHFRSIQRIKELYNISDDVPICVGHWFLDGKLPKDDLKHWDIDYIQTLFPKSRIYSLESGFTHHDSHALSAEIFAGKDFPEDYHTFVVDGFGTRGECYSIYKASELIARYYGFHKSIGLFYQYATAYMGMKMHNHEYKILGYETHIDELIPCPYRIQTFQGSLR